MMIKFDDDSSPAQDLLKIAAALAVLIAASFIFSKSLFWGAPSTAQFIAVVMLSLWLGQPRMLVVLLIYFALVIASVPILPKTPSAQFPMFTYWWPGACVGYFLCAYAASLFRSEEKESTFGRICLVALVPTVALVVPHAIWIWFRLLPTAAIAIVVQGVMCFVALIVIMLLMRTVYNRRTQLAE